MPPIVIADPFDKEQFDFAGRFSRARDARGQQGAGDHAFEGEFEHPQVLPVHRSSSNHKNGASQNSLDRTPFPAPGAPCGMKMGTSRGWTQMDADIPEAFQSLLCNRVHPGLSVVQILKKA